MKENILYIALSFILFASCPLEPTNPVVPETPEIPEEEFILVTSDTVLTLSTGMQTIDITFSTNVNWTANVISNTDWCSIDTKEGTAGENITLSVTVQENKGDARTAEIQLVGKDTQTSVTIVQKEKPVLSLVSSPEVRLAYSDTTTTITFSAREAWTAKTDNFPTYTISPSSGAAGENIEITVTAPSKNYSGYNNIVWIDIDTLDKHLTVQIVHTVVSIKSEQGQLSKLLKEQFGADLDLLQGLEITGELGEEDFGILKDLTKKNLSTISMFYSTVENNAIPARAFGGETSIGSKLNLLYLPSTVTNIGEYAFANINTLEIVSFPKNLTTIEKAAFKGCSKLDYIGLADSVTHIGESAFAGTGIIFFTIPPQITTIEKSAFENCIDLGFIEIRNGSVLETIGESAFRGAKALDFVTLPSTIKHISTNAFSNIPIIAFFTVLSPSPPSIDGTPFGETTIEVLKVPSESRTQYEADSFWGSLALSIATTQ